jgi:hypothetical protein
MLMALMLTMDWIVPAVQQMANGGLSARGAAKGVVGVWGACYAVLIVVVAVRTARYTSSYRKNLR